MAEADTTWLDETSAPAPATTTKVSDDDWLKIEDPNAGTTTAAFREMIDMCVRGTNRVMATSDKYLAYRPFNREFDKETNPRTKERVQMFQENGWIKYIGTYDEVQIWEFLPVGYDGKPNPFYHASGKNYIAGQDYWRDIRTVAKLACERNWPEYHDYLNVMAIAIKTGRDPLFAKTMWDDALGHIGVAIQQIGGAAAPTEKEVNEGFVGVRRARGLQTRGSSIVTLDTSSLPKVGFDGKR